MLLVCCELKRGGHAEDHFVIWSTYSTPWRFTVGCTLGLTRYATKQLNCLHDTAYLIGTKAKWCANTGNSCAGFGFVEPCTTYVDSESKSAWSAPDLDGGGLGPKRGGRPHVWIQNL